MREKCRHPECNSLDSHHLVMVISVWGWEMYWYCKEHKRYGAWLANQEYVRILELQRRLMDNPKMAHINIDGRKFLPGGRGGFLDKMVHGRSLEEPNPYETKPSVNEYKPPKRAKRDVKITDNLTGITTSYKKDNLLKRRHIVYERDGNKCLSCGTPENLTLDHVIPLSKGGNNEEDNLQTLCKKCNHDKGARIRDYRVKDGWEGVGIIEKLPDTKEFLDWDIEVTKLVDTSKLVHI